MRIDRMTESYRNISKYPFVCSLVFHFRTSKLKVYLELKQNTGLLT